MPYRLPSNKGEYVVEEVLQAEQSTTVSRVRHNKNDNNNNNNNTLIIKSNTKLLTQPRRLIKCYQEFIIGSSIHSPFVVRYLDFKKFDYGYAILMEDIGGTALPQLYNYAKQDLPLDIFLHIACKITKGIGAIHEAGVTHKNINPANIVYCETTGELNIIDFGIASQLSKNEVLPTSIPFGDKDLEETHEKGMEMEGTLEYISPEQTGRMNRVVDYRSDFYSLGVTFYELLSGVLPFTQASPNAFIDLVYKHLAVHPRSILEIRPQVGYALWSVIAKLMAKNAEDRYQDYKGLLYDLQEIQRAYKEGRHMNILDFVAGSQDLAMHLQVSQKLYGREEEVRRLARNFEQVCSEGTLPSMLMLVHGYSGVGKTLIVNEVHKPLAKNHGNYVSGKFDQFLSASPYSAIIQALKQLIQQILTENETSLKEWQHRLEKGLNGNGKLMVDLIPDLELVIGPQPEVPMLEAVENVHRFKDVFVGFISSLACKERPLVIFLDDLQWADSNTLRLLLALLTNTEASHAHYLLVVGAYRDNEVDENHPLSLTLQEIRSKGGMVEDVSVSPLREGQVVQLLEDTFNANRNGKHKVDLEPLGTLIYKKTQGNPFFVNQLLTTLHKNGYIRFVSELDVRSSELAHGYWKYDIEAIQKENYTGNVVDLMVSMLRKLPRTAQHMVGVAATIGNQVELWLLAVVSGISEYEARDALNSAVSEGYLIPSSDEFMRNVMFSDENSINLKQLVLPESSAHMLYRFAHDRVQQAAALLISEEDRKIAHGKVAETLLSRFAKDPKDLSNHLLRIATHMNQSFDESTIEYDTNFEEGETKYIFPFQAVRVAEVNYKAALKAKNANAFQQALSYASLGVKLLAKDEEKEWGKYHTLSFDTHQLFFELQVLTGNYSAADATYAQLIPHAISLQAKTDVYITLFHRFELEHRIAESIESVVQALALYGFSLPMDVHEQERAFLADVDLIDKKLVGLTKFSDLSDLRECVDATQRNIIKLLMTVWPAAYMLGMRYLSGYVSSQVVLRSMEHGVCAETGMALVTYVWIIGPITGEYIKLNELARVGLSILDIRYPHHKALRGSSNLLYAIGVSVWVHPMSRAFPYVEMAFELSSQAGNLDFMTFGNVYLVEVPFMCGANLSTAALEFEKKQAFWKEGNYGVYPFMEAVAQPIWDLQGAPKDFLKGQKYEDSVYPKDILLTTSYNYAKLFSSFFLRNDMKKWLEYADVSAVSVPISFTGLYKVSEMQTMTSLVYLDWLCRSPFARETFASKSHAQLHEIGDDELDADIESEVGQTREQQEATLRRRIEMVKSSIQSLTKASLQCKANFEHRVLLLKAEASRVALALSSRTIFSSEETTPGDSEYNTANGFEETIELYERAIEGAKLHGFKQYEALGLELYGRFWLTNKRSRPRIALLYLTEAIMAYERWGATEKARLLSEECELLARNDPVCFHSMDLPSQKASASVVSLDLETIVQASQTICNETDVSALTIKMVKTIVENASAERGTFFAVDDTNIFEGGNHPAYAYKDSLMITAECDYEHVAQQLEGSSLTAPGLGVVLCDPKLPLRQWSDGPVSLVRFVGRTRKAVVLGCAHKDAQFGSDQYISNKKVKSIICMPILLNKALKGVMYLENNLCEGMYTQSRVDLLSVLTSQMAISLENIKFLHEQIREQSEKIRFEQLQREEAVQRQRADTAEKYKVQLENFIDMICHEIRNPLNGIFGNTDLIIHYLGQFEAAYRRQTWMNLPVVTSPISTQQSPAPLTKTHPHSLSMRNNNPTSPRISSTQLRLATAQDGSPLDLDGGTGADIYSSCLEQIRICAATIQSCAEHQKRMTDDVLQLSRLRSHKLAVENVYYRPWDMVQTTLRVFRVQADKKGLELRFEPQGLDERSEIFGDSMRTYQILSNLLSNAIKFTLKGSITVVVCIEESKSDEDNIAEEVHSEAEDHNEVPHKEVFEKETAPCIFTMCVADTGIGMTAKEQERIFKRFSQANNRTSKEYGGSGLGLSISKLAKLMNGTISLESEERKGSTFTVQLHCNRVLESSLSLSTHSMETIPSFNLPPDLLSADSLTDSVDQLPQLPQPPILPVKGEEGEVKGKVEPPKPQRILVAEDNMMNQTLLRKVLPMKGYIVEITSNGDECVTRYQEHQRREGDKYYSFVLMDIQMPLMDGLVATELIRRFERENNISPIVIIGLSGNARDEYRQTALAAGMNEYITKPYHKEVLYAALAKNSS